MMVNTNLYWLSNLIDTLIVEYGKIAIQYSVLNKKQNDVPISLIINDIESKHQVRGG